MVEIPLFTGFYTSQVVQDFFHQQYVYNIHFFCSKSLCLGLVFSEVFSLLDLHLFFSKTNLVFFWIRWVWIGMHPHPVCQWPPGWHYIFRLRDSFWTFICHQISTSSHYFKSRSDTVCFCLPDHFLRQYFHRTFTAVPWYHSLFSPWRWVKNTLRQCCGRVFPARLSPRHRRNPNPQPKFSHESLIFLFSLGNQTWCKCMVNLNEFPFIKKTSALIGLGWCLSFMTNLQGNRPSSIPLYSWSLSLVTTTLDSGTDGDFWRRVPSLPFEDSPHWATITMTWG